MLLAGCGARTGLSDLSGSGVPNLDGGGPPFDGGPNASCRVDAATILSAGGTEINAVVVGDTSVYWADFSKGVVSIDKLGIQQQQVLGTGNGSYALTVAGGFVYWADFDGNDVRRAPITPGTFQVLATNQYHPSGVAVIGNDVYWTTYNGGSVARLHGSSTPEVLVQEPDAGVAGYTRVYTSITTDGHLVFWAAQSGAGDVHRYDPTTGTITLLADKLSGAAWAIATDGVNVYFNELEYKSNQMTIASVPVGGGSTIALATVSTDETACPGGGCQGAVATDSQFVYFTSDATDGFVRKVPVGGGTPTVIADHQAQPFGIAVDDACVYWSNFADGKIMIAPK